MATKRKQLSKVFNLLIIMCSSFGY